MATCHPTSPSTRPLLAPDTALSSPSPPWPLGSLQPLRVPLLCLTLNVSVAEISSVVISVGYVQNQWGASKTCM